MPLTANERGHLGSDEDPRLFDLGVAEVMNGRTAYVGTRYAVSALDVDEMSGGRFRLGLGAGVKRLNETWHGVEYGRPAPHLREAIEAFPVVSM